MSNKLYSIFIFVLITASAFTLNAKKGPHVEAFGLPGAFGGLVTASIYCPNTSSFLRYIYGPKGGVNMWMPGATYNYANYTGYIPDACVLGQSSGVMTCCATYVCYGAGYISLFEGSSVPGCDITGASGLAAHAGAIAGVVSAFLALDLISGSGDSSNDTVWPGLDSVTWRDRDVSDWAEDAYLKPISINGTTIRMDYDKKDSWPEGYPLGGDEPLVANAWLFYEDNGTWYGETWEWLRPGQIDKSTDAITGGGHLRSLPASWRPVNGKIYGFMVSGFARVPQTNIPVRSNIQFYQWGVGPVTGTERN